MFRYLYLRKPMNITRKQTILLLPLLNIAVLNLIAAIIRGVPDKSLIFSNVVAYMLAAILEELFFRGYLIYLCVDSFKISKERACVVSAFVFGIMHLTNLMNGARLVETIVQVICAISAGWCFAVITCATESVWIAVALHLITNATSACISETSEVGMISVIILIMSLLLAVVNVYYVKRVLQKRLR